MRLAEIRSALPEAPRVGRSGRRADIVDDIEAAYAFSKADCPSDMENLMNKFRSTNAVWNWPLRASAGST